MMKSTATDHFKNTFKPAHGKTIALLNRLPILLSTIRCLIYTFLLPCGNIQIITDKKDTIFYRKRNGLMKITSSHIPN